MGEPELRVVEEFQAALPSEDIVAALADPESQQHVARLLNRLGTPDMEVRMVGPEYLGATGFVGSGMTGFTAVWTEWTSAFQNFHVEIEETIDAGDVILSLVRISGRSKTDGVPVEQSGGATWTVHEGRVSKVEFHLYRDSALRAAGLSQEAGD